MEPNTAGTPPAPEHLAATPFPAPAGFYSAPASPIHHSLAAAAAAAAGVSDGGSPSPGDTPEFDFSARLNDAAMTSADELFLNGQIRPIALFPSPPPAAPRGRDPTMRGSRSVHRRARSMSPTRQTSEFDWRAVDPKSEPAAAAAEEEEVSSASAAPSLRNSKKWVFLKELLYRSKSEGSGNGRERFWQFSKEKEKEKEKAKKGAEKRRKGSASAHERIYAAKRAEAEEMRRRTFLPYRQGFLLGCLGFSAVDGLARTLLSSR